MSVKDIDGVANRKSKTSGASDETPAAPTTRTYETARVKEQRWQVYAAIPKGDWSAMSGRQIRTINEQAERYGLPLLGRTIDLRDFVRAFHDFLADNKYKLARGGDPAANGDQMLYADATSPALERYRDERAKLAKLERLQREGTLIDRAQIHEALGRIASIIRAAGETLDRNFGADAHSLLDDALDDAERAIMKLLGGGVAEPPESSRSKTLGSGRKKSRRRSPPAKRR